MKRSYFHQNLALFSATEVSVLTSPLDGSCHTYSTVKERKNQVVALEYENIKNPVDMKSFTLQIKLLKRLFTAKYNQIYIYIYIFISTTDIWLFNLMFRRTACKHHTTSKLKRKVFLGNYQNNNRDIDVELTFTF